MLTAANPRLSKSKRSLPLMFSVIISMRCIISIEHHGELAGKTPDIPRDILLEVLGPSKVYKEVIKKVINSTVSEYVDKEGLKVIKDLRVEQSFEDLEDAFEPDEKFSFDAVIQLQQTT
uniref:peptidylprolyl isomerase n=1 Tax=Salix viminalis TaxID=40686 RepID=A0A6N2M4U2_SALVM